MISKLHISLLTAMVGIFIISPVSSLKAGPVPVKYVSSEVPEIDDPSTDSESEEEPTLKEKFMKACQEGDYTVINTLLNNLILSTYSDGETNLTFLANSKSVQSAGSLKLLLQLSQILSTPTEMNHYINQKNKKLGGGSSLIIALTQNNKKCAQILIGAGVSLDTVSNQFGNTPLMIAATETDLSTVKMIVDKYQSQLKGTLDQKTALLKTFLNKKAPNGLAALNLAEQNEGAEKDNIINYLKSLGAKKGTPISSPISSPVPWDHD